MAVSSFELRNRCKSPIWWLELPNVQICFKVVFQDAGKQAQ
jgi:hypothetical protein